MTAKTCNLSDSDKAVISGSPKFDLLFSEEVMSISGSREVTFQSKSVKASTNSQYSKFPNAFS